mgnify:CR=1 FL=1
MKKAHLLTLFLLCFIMVKAQNGDFGIKFSGFVKTDIIFDSRQTVNLREGHFLLYPAAVKLDQEGNDVNAVPNFNILAIQTRLAGSISGPDALKAKTSAYMEGEFFGHSDADINGFRLRHAWIKMNWGKKELLIGQYWHPMFITESFPEVLSFNTGAPFHAFSRNPQIRYLQEFGDIQLIGTVFTQRDFSSFGGSSVLRNSAIPELNFKIQRISKNTDKNTELLTGASVNYQVLLPRLASTQNYQTTQKVLAFAYNAYFKMKLKDITFKLEGTYGQNLYDLTMTGGYAYKFTDDTNIINKGLFEYTTLDALSFWSELMTNGKKWQYGIFGGYCKNLGSLQNIYNWQSSSSYFARGADIDYFYRISPRIVFNSGKLRLAGEVEYTVAAYGKISENNSRGQVTNSDPVANARVLLGAFYFF